MKIQNWVKDMQLAEHHGKIVSVRVGEILHRILAIAPLVQSGAVQLEMGKEIWEHMNGVTVHRKHLTRIGTIPVLTNPQAFATLKKKSLRCFHFQISCPSFTFLVPMSALLLKTLVPSAP